ncbi:hypothetical protein QBC38DRAFT_484601 [Podospora fimiseda]|uniref:Uncharacterized protein n=1 Tax=Podospora fimiseda TaxID=252190 RepID=A0AAN7GQS7_9PEZI|nr:hypothetical protein QBC38DRAFT_484601 [Podospora fimiseda]
MYQTYPQHAFPFGAWDNVANHHHFGHDDNSNMWMDNLAISTYYTTTDASAMYQPTANDNLWSSYTPFPASSVDDPSPSTVASSPSMGMHGQGWPNTPEQPLPSPGSEIPPYSQYSFQYTAPSDGDFQAGVACPTTEFATQPRHTTLASQSSQSSSTSSKPKNKAKGKAPVSKPAKKSDAPSPKARVTKRKSPSPTTTTTPHIGIFPPNVDPKKASQKLQREAWEKAKVEAMAMSQRRLMLLDHERGALERETQKLQVNLGLMRESVARQHSELQEAISKAERLNRY